jgi:hypothetical protein
MRYGFAFAMLLALPLSAVGAEAGYTSRELQLKAEPATGAAVLATLPKGAKVEILGERKAWSKVRSGPATGWALSFYVMRGEPAGEVGLGRRLSEAWSLGTERRAETSATIGVRGLDEEELRSAQFDAGELERLEALPPPKDDVERFAKQGGLVPQDVQYLAAPGQ